MVNDCAKEFGWLDNETGILKIPKDLGQNPIEYVNLVEEYGTVTIDMVRTYELTFIDQPERRAQDTYMLYLCLRVSLSEVGRSKIDI